MAVDHPALRWSPIGFAFSKPCARNDTVLAQQGDSGGADFSRNLATFSGHVSNASADRRSLIFWASERLFATGRNGGIKGLPLGLK